jgi:hypothetical protein
LVPEGSGPVYLSHSPKTLLPINNAAVGIALRQLEVTAGDHGVRSGLCPGAAAVRGSAGLERRLRCSATNPTIQSTCKLATSHLCSLPAAMRSTTMEDPALHRAGHSGAQWPIAIKASEGCEKVCDSCAVACVWHHWFNSLWRMLGQIALRGQCAQRRALWLNTPQGHSAKKLGHDVRV